VLSRSRPRVVSRPIRVVHLITDLDVGGAEMMLARLVAGMDRDAIDNTVISLTSGGAVAERIAGSGVRVVSLDMQPGRLNIGGVPRLVRLLRQMGPDVLQTWLYHADLLGLIAGTVARIPAIVWNIRCSHLVMSDYSASLPSIIRILALSSRRPAAVVCNSVAGQQVHHELGYRPRRWEIIPNGVDIEVVLPTAAARAQLREELHLPASSSVVGLIGRFHPMKGHTDFLQAAARVCRETDDVYFVAIGRGVGSSGALRQLLAELGIERRIRLMEERTDVAGVLAGLDVVVSASTSGEGFPNVIVEAMAAGVPCVVTDVGDAAAIVGDSGVVVRPADPPALASGISQLLRLSTEKRASLARRVRERVVEEFSIRQAATRYEQLYRQLAAARTS
jgi:glycosyltransferase involved in cell wall biosynthesis